MNSKITLFFISLLFVCIAKAEDHQLQDMDLSGYKESGTGGFVSSSRQRPPFGSADFSGGREGGVKSIVLSLHNETKPTAQSHPTRSPDRQLRHQSI